MAEYIEREALERCILGLTIVDPAVAQYANAVLQCLKDAPAADVAPVVHGKWVKEVYVDPYGADWTRYHCSLCGGVEIRKEPYCNCGAKMDL